MRPPRSYPLLAEPRPAVRFFLLGSVLSISLTSSLRSLYASARGLIVLLGDSYPQHLKGLSEPILVEG